MDLSIIILSYNTKNLTIACVRSILEQYKDEINKKKVEIILVDNNSTDDSVASLRKLSSQIKIIESGENLGFSNGCNLGAGKASAENLLFLNSDTAVKDKGFLKMVEFLRADEKIAILGGKLENPDKTLQKNCGRFYNLFNLTLVLLGLERSSFLRFSPKSTRKVDWVTGACLMIKSDIFNQIGRFNKNIFMYMEDQELCYKAKLKGFDTYFYKDVEVVHKERGSSNRAFAIINIYKGIKYFYKQYKPTWQYLLAVFMLKAKALILVILGRIINNKYLIGAYWTALKT